MKQKAGKIIKWILIAVGVICLLLLVYIVREYRLWDFKYLTTLQEFPVISTIGPIGDNYFDYPPRNGFVVAYDCEEAVLDLEGSVEQGSFEMWVFQTGDDPTHGDLIDDTIENWEEAYPVFYHCFYQAGDTIDIHASLGALKAGGYCLWSTSPEDVELRLQFTVFTYRYGWQEARYRFCRDWNDRIHGE